MSFPCIFVTVGTTRFDELVQTIQTPLFLKTIKDLDCKHLIVQHGSSPITLPHSPSPSHSDNTITSDDDLTTTFYPYKSTLHLDMQDASLIISHAGSGSILESLKLHKPLIVVINRSLMDDHQSELAEALEEEGHLVKTDAEGLVECLRGFGGRRLREFPESDGEVFVEVLREQLGFRKRE
ncbi:N-acetylglucosaminyldiphosphodolichol N-acetylglucosaminyltransferase catalytic subunit alg13 [Quaeritorhiza haematococci]|nr:N-acetylglucosaminyldiphosphodolichol N-acetylglucosaminyltransferase catalytic subunit alg13 [Quaeritorhiza haematococci]